MISTSMGDLERQGKGLIPLSADAQLARALLGLNIPLMMSFSHWSVKYKLHSTVTLLALAHS
jgi:hypothetical protein